MLLVPYNQKKITKKQEKKKYLLDFFVQKELAKEKDFAKRLQIVTRGLEIFFKIVNGEKLLENLENPNFRLIKRKKKNAFQII